MRPRLIDFLHQMNWTFYIPTFKALYIFMIVLAIALSTIIASKRNLPIVKFYIVTVFICIMALIGGITYNYLKHKGVVYIFDTPQTLSNIGVGSYGAYLLGILAAIVSLKLMRIDVLTGLDIYSPVAAITHALGRIACFMSGCCFGKLSDLPWAVKFPVSSPAYNSHLYQGLITSSDKYSLPVHPIQIYDMIFSIILFIFLLRNIQKQRIKGLLFFSYIFLMSMFRFFMEFLRDDFRLTVYLMSLPQIFSLVFILIGIGGLCVVLHKND
jgi:phosphatidylglycerol:prolipoprotein diacylglycerol transferase